MGYLNILEFDFDSVLEFLRTLGLKIIGMPTTLLNKLPIWTKYVFFFVLLAASVAIGIWWWNNREEWRKYKRV